MLKGANIEGEDDEEEKIQDMEGLSWCFLSFFCSCMLLSLATQSGAYCSRVPVIFRVRNQKARLYSNSNLNVKNESMAPS